MSKENRRKFIKKASLGGLMLLGTRLKANEEVLDLPNFGQTNKQISANDKIRIGFVGCGIQGLANASSASKVGGVEIAAACDLYDGRLTMMQEKFGKDVKISRDFREMLAMKDIDAICISTSDHWHDHMLKEALKAGKAVYCEKPMMHHLDEGLSMVEAEKKAGLPVQVGSQRVTSLEVLKAAELYKSGAIGDLVLIDARSDRNSSNGAWQYSIPTDASPETVDWDAFLGDAPKRAFDKTRFFRWRNYDDYGTGVAGDLFVHLFTSLHVITGSLGPSKIYGTGGLRFWKDGRDAPDVTLGLLDYAASSNHPAFNVQMRVNFVDGSGGGSHVRLIGTEGYLSVEGDGVTLVNKPIKTEATYGGWDSYGTFSQKQQQEYKQWFEAVHGNDNSFKIKTPQEIKYSIPEGYNAHVHHWQNFIKAIKNGDKIVEDASFGLRAAAPSLGANMSMKEGKALLWDPIKMKLI